MTGLRRPQSAREPTAQSRALATLAAAQRQALRVVSAPGDEAALDRLCDLIEETIDQLSEG